MYTFSGFIIEDYMCLYFDPVSGHVVKLVECHRFKLVIFDRSGQDGIRTGLRNNIKPAIAGELFYYPAGNCQLDVRFG